MLKFIALLLLLTSLTALADTKLGIMGSLLYNNSDTDALEGVTASIDEVSELSFGLGVRALMGINDQLFFRSGAGIVQKKWSYDVTGLSGDLTASVTYLNIPVTFYWKGSPKAGFFGGTNIQAKLDDKLETSGDFSGVASDLKNAKTIVLPLVLGFDFEFTEQFAMEISYEYGIMDTAKDVKVSSGVLSFIYNLPN